MSLVAAIAVGLAAIRYSHMRYFVWEHTEVAGRVVYPTLCAVGRLVYGILPILYALCVVVLAKVPRSGNRWSAAFSCSPGAAACFAVLLTLFTEIVFQVVQYAVRLVRSHNPIALFDATAYWEFCAPTAIDGLFRAAGPAAMPAVLAVWLVQFFCGLWRPAPDWHDRLGRAVGFVILLWMLTPH
jgi:hypothetical protein